MKNMFQIAASALALILVLGACGDGKGGPGAGGGDGKDGQVSYEIEENGCKTGKHEFANFEAYCNGLKDNQLNNGCGRFTRAEMFRNSKCPGNF